MKSFPYKINKSKYINKYIYLMKGFTYKIHQSE